MNTTPGLVLDTNVLVSGLLSPQCPPGRLLLAFRDSLYTAAICEAIVTEYGIVLNRPRFPFAGTTAVRTVSLLLEHGLWVPVLRNPGIRLVDASDQPFYDCAFTAGCALVTGNLKHFPTDGPVPVLSLREAVERLLHP